MANETRKISLTEVNLPDRDELSAEVRNQVRDFRQKIRRKEPLGQRAVVRSRSDGRFVPVGDTSLAILRAIKIENFQRCTVEIAPRQERRVESKKKPVEKPKPPKAPREPESKRIPLVPSGPRSSGKGDPQAKEFVEVMDWKAFGKSPPEVQSTRLMHIIEKVAEQLPEIYRRKLLTAQMRYLGQQGIIVEPAGLHSADFDKKLKFAW